MCKIYSRSQKRICAQKLRCVLARNSLYRNACTFCKPRNVVNSCNAECMYMTEKQRLFTWLRTLRSQTDKRRIITRINGDCVMLMASDWNFRENCTLYSFFARKESDTMNFNLKKVEKSSIAVAYLRTSVWWKNKYGRGEIVVRIWNILDT